MLDMGGFIDDCFLSRVANQITQTGGDYVDGIWVPGVESTTPYRINIQPVNTRDIQSLSIGAERIQDYRVLHVNDGDFHALSPDAFWEFDVNNRGIERYKVINSDIRISNDFTSRNFAYLVVCLIDGEPNA